MDVPATEEDVMVLPDTARVNPVTLAGLRCELRVNLRDSSPFLVHRPCVACGPLQDRMEAMIRDPDPLDAGARMVVAHLDEEVNRG